MSSFDYDPQKSARNKDKHGIDFEKAQALWLNRVEVIPAKVENGEKRYAAIGKIDKVHWTAIITYRGDVRRIISVYASSAGQINYYEQVGRPAN